MALEPGLVGEVKMIVSEKDTAAAISEKVVLPPVLSTPQLVNWMEKAAYTAIAPFLKEGQSSVGASIQIRHMAATPVGIKVRIRAELISMERRRLNFKVEAWDELEKVAEGEHERFIIDVRRFNENFQQKIDRLK
jgi:predicted thioesterase